MKENITFKQYELIASQLRIQMGQVMTASRIPKKDRLIQLGVRFGSDKTELKTVVTNLGETMEPEAFIGQLIPFITNLEPSKFGGVLSEAMIMVAKGTIEKFKGETEVFDHDYSVGTEFLLE